MIFPVVVVGLGSWRHACNEVHGFIHYNVKYIMFIVAYMTLILEFPHMASNIRVCACTKF